MKQIAKVISQANSILLFTHTNPDGDAIGSCHALKEALKAMGKEAVVLLEEPLSSLFSCFAGGFVLEDEIQEKNFDLKVSLDCGDLERLGKGKEYFTGETVNIDHHVTNTHFAKYNYVGNNAATGEIVFELLQQMAAPITKETANGLYTAILTDTGGFMYANTTPKTHEIIGTLMAAGADFYELNKRFIQEKSYSKQLIQAKCIEKMLFYANEKIALCGLNYDLCQELSITSDELSGLSAIPRTIKGVEVGILMTELHKGIIKVSLRSDSFVDVSAIAASFGGGGHKRASGFQIQGEFIEIQTLLLDKTLDELKKVEEND